MRELQRLLRHRVALRPAAVAWLTIAALLALNLGQSLHAASATHVDPAGSEISLFAAAHPLPSQPARHAADLCPVCRATAQARLGVRVSAGVSEIAASDIGMPLPRPAAERAAAAPALRDARPRAPPTALRALSA